MATIESSIMLMDGMSRPLNNIIGAIETTINALNSVNNTDVNIDTSRLSSASQMIASAGADLLAYQERLQAQINRNTSAQQRFNETLRMGNAGSTGPQVFGWNSSQNMQIFTSQGTQRYRQELNDLNSILNRMSGINISPSFRINSSATSDIDTINQRIEALKESMKALSTNNLGLSTEQSNARLERMRAQLSAILQVQNNLNGAMGRMDIADINAQYQRLNDILGNTEADIRDNTAAQDEFNRSILQGSRHSDGLLSKIGRIALAYAGFQTLRSGINLSDTLTQNVARLNLMNDGNQTTDELQAMIYQAAGNSRGDALANIESISKMGLMAGDAFSSNTELIGFMELINKQFKISGTSAEGISAAMLQLTQAMGAGALRGEELNSILEQAPLIVKNIANYLKVPVGQIKDLASQGKITSEVVKKAMFNAADTINQQFNSIPLTFADITTSMRNEAVKKFQNISSQFSSVLNSDRFKSFTNSLVNSIGVVLDIASRGMTALTTLGATIYDNWAIIGPVVQSVAGIMAVYAGAVVISTIANGAMAISQFGVAVAMGLYNLVLGKSIAATHQQTLAMWGLNAAIAPYVLIAGAVVAALYLGVAAFNKFAGTSISATGIIAGSLMYMWTSAKNTLFAMYNNALGVIQLLSNAVLSGVEFIVNMLFGNPFKAIGNLILDGVNLALDGLKLLTKMTDTILGTNYSATIDGLKSKIDNFRANVVGENDIKLPRLELEGYMVNNTENPFEAAKNTYDYWANFNLKEEGKEATEKLLGEIAKNTEVSANNSDLTTEEIKYMRDLAEMEVINRFTTAEIKVEVGGITNQVNNSMDVESIYSNIGDKLREAVLTGAEGVYD